MRERPKEGMKKLLMLAGSGIAVLAAVMVLINGTTALANEKEQTEEKTSYAGIQSAEETDTFEQKLDTPQGRWITQEGTVTHHKMDRTEYEYPVHPGYIAYTCNLSGGYEGVSIKIYKRPGEGAGETASTEPMYNCLTGVGDSLYTEGVLTWFLEDYRETGSYYFTLQAVNDLDPSMNSDVFTSEDFNFVATGNRITTPDRPTINEEGKKICFTLPEGTKGYLEEIYLKRTAKSTPVRLGSIGRSFDLGEDDHFWETWDFQEDNNGYNIWISSHGYGYYSGQITAYSLDPRVKQLSRTSERSDWLHIPGKTPANDSLDQIYKSIPVSQDGNTRREIIEKMELLDMEMIINAMNADNSNTGTVSKITAIEEKAFPNVTVEVPDEENDMINGLQQLTASDVHFYGLALNVEDDDEEIKVTLEKKSVPNDFPAGFDNPSAFCMDLSCDIVSYGIRDLATPVKVEMPVPSGMKEEALKVIQFNYYAPYVNGMEPYEVITPTIRTVGGKRVAAFVLHAFYGEDTFVFCEGTPEITPYIQGGDITLYEGDETPLSITLSPEGYEDKADIIWNSDKKDVATVDNNGVVKGISEGTAIITVSVGENSSSVKVTVKKKIALNGISFSKTELDIAKGETAQLDLTFDPADAYNRNVTWHSDKEVVATVSPGGVVTGISDGEANITATSEEGGFVASIKVKVTTVTLTAIALKPETLSLAVGETATLSAVFTPSNATDKRVKWTTDDEKVASVENGKITAIAPGSTVITVSSALNDSIKASCTVTVTEAKQDDGNEDNKKEETTVIPVSSVSLNKKNVTLKMGVTETLTAAIFPDNASNRNVTWISGDTGVVTVLNGTLTPVGVGQTDVTVKAVDGGSTASCAVTVVAESLDESQLAMIKNEEYESGYTPADEKKTETKEPKKTPAVKINGEKVEMPVKTEYSQAITYTGNNIKPQDLGVKIDTSSIIDGITMKEGAAITPDKLIEPGYVSKSNKDAGTKAAFYPQIKITKEAKKALTTKEYKKLKKKVDAVNKELKKTANQCKYTINKRSVTDGKLEVTVNLMNDGKIKLNKNGKISKVRSVKLTTKDTEGKDIVIKLSSKNYKIELIDADTGLVRVTGKKNFTGTATVYVVK